MSNDYIGGNQDLHRRNDWSKNQWGDYSQKWIQNGWAESPHQPLTPKGRVQTYTITPAIVTKPKAVATSPLVRGILCQKPLEVIPTVTKGYISPVSSNAPNSKVSQPTVWHREDEFMRGAEIPLLILS